ncbi:8337_t:CDS:2 [Diversispora eburnea]|uniref:8337_t:CDS:1 n=1 Tax=Diversispora eburnea TaxID=1213867 RepID=A0A9N9BG16_9GLOM|nr:8337_t:CDS:2 [Diversispora eburnea]
MTRSSSFISSVDSIDSVDSSITSLISPLYTDSLSPSTPATPPPSNHQRYKDLLIFEERLKQNLHQLQKRSYKYEVVGV